MTTIEDKHSHIITLQWRHNGRDSVSNHQLHDCLLNRIFRRISKKTSKLRVTGVCAGNSPGTGEFPAQMASYAENVSIWWRHHEGDRSEDLCARSSWKQPVMFICGEQKTGCNVHGGMNINQKTEKKKKNEKTATKDDNEMN